MKREVGPCFAEQCPSKDWPVMEQGLYMLLSSVLQGGADYFVERRDWLESFCGYGGYLDWDWKGEAPSVAPLGSWEKV